MRCTHSLKPKVVLAACLEKIRRLGRQDFVEHDTVFSELLAEVYKKEKNWEKAAEVLMGMRAVEAGADGNKNRQSRTFVEIAELALKMNNRELLETYCTKAGMQIHQDPSDPVYLRYRNCQARLEGW